MCLRTFEEMLQHVCSTHTCMCENTCLFLREHCLKGGPVSSTCQIHGIIVVCFSDGSHNCSKVKAAGAQLLPILLSPAVISCLTQMAAVYHSWRLCGKWLQPGGMLSKCWQIVKSEKLSSQKLALKFQTDHKELNLIMTRAGKETTCHHNHPYLH